MLVYKNCNLLHYTLDDRAIVLQLLVKPFLLILLERQIVPNTAPAMDVMNILARNWFRKGSHSVDSSTPDDPPQTARERELEQKLKEQEDELRRYHGKHTLWGFSVI